MSCVLEMIAWMIHLTAIPLLLFLPSFIQLSTMRGMGLLLCLFFGGEATLQTTTLPTTAHEHFLTAVSTSTTSNLNDIIKDGKLVVKLGHIGAMGALRNDERILGISRKSLHREGILGDDLDVDIISQNGCGDSYEGVAVAADMYHLQKVKAFIGPYCNAAYWNLPIIGYMAASNALADKRAYKTLARISTRSTNSIAEATCALLKHYKWNKVAIVTNLGIVAYDRTVAFEEVFHARGVQVVKKIIFDEYANAALMRKSGLIEEVRDSARVIIFLFSNTRESSKEFMSAAQGEGMLASEFVFILPWLQTDFGIDKKNLQDGGKEASPWIGPDGAMLQTVKDQYANAIIIDDVNGFDNTIVAPFLARLKEDGLTEKDIDVANIYAYVYLFDALKLYALAARKVLNETGNPSAVLDGVQVWNAMRRMNFQGILGKSGIASGSITMDDRSERAPLYRGFFISPQQDQAMAMVHMEPTMIDGARCDGLANRSGCYDIVVTDMMTHFWPSPDARMPLDEPVCGFRDEKCDYTLVIIAAALAVVLVAMLMAACLIRRCLEKRALDNLPFRLFRDDVQLIDEEQVKSMLSIGSTRTKMSSMNYGSRNHAIVGTNTHAVYHRYAQRRPILFTRADKNMFQYMKGAVHDNANPFLGICFNEKEELFLVWKFCNRGTLQDVIYNDQIQMDAKFHGAFIKDIIGGLEYLHTSPIGYHGSLTPWSCLIDRNWMVKLTDYGVAEPIERWEKQQWITVDDLKNDEDKCNAKQKTSALYDAPEMLKMREKNKWRRVDQDWQRQSNMKRQLGDIYGFGMIIYEIIFRSLPFPDSQDITELIDAVKDGDRVIKPLIQDHKLIHMDLATLIQDCWHSTPEMRPSLRRIKLNVEAYLKVKGSLVDQMMRMMEQYANNLEKLVQERTGMLEDANVRADKLLNQLLPAYVARELKEGKPVLPKTFQSSTVMFSDIVGFGDMCRDASAAEIVNLLNSVFNVFDEFINRREAYKVETIGDAYMFVSGVPEENGTRHLNSICSIALDIHTFLDTYRAPHSSSLRVSCRLGVCSGPVAAAVVGLNAPRYCLFGDTVNMASRMESTGEGGRTQLAESTKIMLDKHYPDFVTVERGKVEVKGKGECTTYWLEGTKDCTFVATAAKEAFKAGRAGNNFTSLVGKSISKTEGPPPPPRISEMKRAQSSPLKDSKRSKENLEHIASPTQHHIKIDTDSLKKVIVFEDRAELKREFTVTLEPGLNEVIIEPISNYICEDSVRVTGSGDAVIEEVKVANRKVTEGTGDSERAKKLRSEKEALEKKKKTFEFAKTSLKNRIEALDEMLGKVGKGIANPANAKFSADKETLASVTNFFEFYDQQATELREKLSTNKEECGKIEAEIDLKRIELDTIDYGPKYKVVSVLLDSTKGGEVTLQLVYQVTTARWYPFYDVRVDTKEGKANMQLSYFANVSQKTGEDWEGAQLVLSTARPCLGGIIPDLGTLDVVIYQAPPPAAARSGKRMKIRKPRGMDFNLSDVEVDSDDSDADEYDDDDDGPTIQPLSMGLTYRDASLCKQTLSTEFQIARPCSIPSTANIDHKVTIGIINLDPQLVHVSVPSKNACAFLTASAINSSSLPLLNGPASIYLDGAFVTKSKITSTSPDEHFITSLGVDTAVKIEYRPAHKHHVQTGGMFTRQSTTVTEQKIVVRNTRQDAILLTVREQIPRSTDEKIKVTMIAPSDVEKVDDAQQLKNNQSPKEGVRLLPSNNLEWTITMDQGSSQTLLVKYSIEHSSTEKIEFVQRRK